MHDLGLAASGEQQKTDDVRLLLAVLADLSVEDAVQAGGLLAGQEAGQGGTPVPLQALLDSGFSGFRIGCGVSRIWMQAVTLVRSAGS
ncbi:MAG: hypothetical protein OXI74_07625 [Rhodospirillaceae bacterium]|nr:hypothetical protein [Rhodospirillaceae bacterium]